MKASSFEYVAAKSVAHASASLGVEGATTVAIAGGQSLLPMLNLRVVQPDLVVDLSRLDELREISVSADTVRIGALTTHAQIEDGQFGEIFVGLLQKVAAKISYRAVRHFGTIGGSVALADPAADWPGCLMALDAQVIISGAKGVRTEPIRAFIQGQYQTSLAIDEIVVAIEVPRPASPFRWGLCKVARKSGAFASSIAIAVSQGEDKSVCVVLAAAASRPHVLPKVTQLCASGTSSEGALRAAITEDVGPLLAQDDAYLMRLHTSTVMHAVRELQRR